MVKPIGSQGLRETPLSVCVSATSLPNLFVNYYFAWRCNKSTLSLWTLYRDKARELMARQQLCCFNYISLIKSGILPLMSRVTQCVSTTPPTKKVSSLPMSVLRYAYTSGLSQRFGFTQQDFKDPTSGPNVVSFSGCCIFTNRAHVTGFTRTLNALPEGR